MRSTSDKTLDFMERLGEELSTQDNRATNAPMFTVMDQRPHRDYEVVDVFFTNNDAELYIARHGHNLYNPWIYVASGWRNPTWCTIRELAMEVYRQRNPSTEEETL